MSKRLTFRIKSNASYNRLKKEAQILHINVSELVRRRALNQPLPHIVFTNNKQYSAVQSQLRAISEALSTLGADTQGERQAIIYNLMVKAINKNGNIDSPRLAEAILSDKNSQDMKQLLNFDKEKLQPALKRISNQFTQLKYRLDHAMR